MKINTFFAGIIFGMLISLWIYKYDKIQSLDTTFIFLTVFSLIGMFINLIADKK